MNRLPLWFLALAVTVLMQITSSFLAQAMTVIGPTLTAAAGVVPERIGHLASMISLGTLWFLVSGHVLLPRLGSVRVLQLGAVVGAAALLVALTGSWAAMMVSALLIGVGYGPSPPAGSELLMRHAPRRRRALIFSIKQAGAPFGSAVAGLLMPSLVARFDWRVALAACAGLSILGTLAAEPLRKIVDTDRAPGRGSLVREVFSSRAVILPFRVIGSRRALRWLAGTGFSFACVQGCVFSFFVTYLNTALGFGLTEAGVAFAVLQAVGMAARVVMGFIADRRGSAIRVLILLGLASSAAAVLAGAMSAAWPWWLIVAASGVVGFASASWNGIYTAEVARVAPEGRVGEATSGVTFLTFLGYVAGPAGFATLIQASGSYALSFWSVAVLPLVSVALLLRARAVSEERAQADD